MKRSTSVHTLWKMAATQTTLTAACPSQLAVGDEGTIGKVTAESRSFYCVAYHAHKPFLLKLPPMHKAWKQLFHLPVCARVCVPLGHEIVWRLEGNRLVYLCLSQASLWSL